MNFQTVGMWVVGSGGLLTGSLSLYSMRANLGKTNSESGLNDATRKKIEVEAKSIVQEAERKREEFWNKKFDDNEKNFDKQIADLQDEVSWLRMLIENHIPWDWEVQRLLIKAGIEHRRPPTLQYVKNNRRKAEEA